MKKLTFTVFAVIFCVAMSGPSVAGGAPSHSNVSPKVALRVAHALVAYLGYSPSASNHIDYEITDRPHAQAYAGYITVQAMINAKPIFNMSVNIRTGQAADFLVCQIFAYPIIEHTERKLGFRPATPIKYKSMMSANGCDPYKVFRNLADLTNYAQDR